MNVTLADLQLHINCDEEKKLRKPLETNPHPNELVLAPYQDGRYYRANVTNYSEKMCDVSIFEEPEEFGICPCPDNQLYSFVQ